MEDFLQVWWRGAKIGKFEITAVDMWYLDGNWHPDASPEAKLFETLVSTFNFTEIRNSPEKGTRIILRSAESSPGTNALVIAMQGDLLMIRQIFDEKAVQWLTKNVH